MPASLADSVTTDLRALFDSADVNGDGQLSLDEVGSHEYVGE